MRLLKIFVLFVVIVLYLSNYLYCSEKTSACVIFSDSKEVLLTVWDNCKAVLEEQHVSGPVIKCNLETQSPDEIFSIIKKNRFDMVYVFGSAAFEFAENNINDVPVVFSVVYTDQQKKLASNQAGVSIKVSEKIRLESFLDMFPQFRKLGFFYSEDTQAMYEEIKNVCSEKGIELIARKIDNEKDFPARFSEISPKISLFYTIPDSKIYFVQSIKYLLFEGLKQKVIVAGLSSFFTKAGAVVSLEPDYGDIGRQTGELAVSIINGAKPESIGVVFPRKLSYSINIQAAHRLGIKISRQVLSSAREVYGK